MISRIEQSKKDIAEALIQLMKKKNFQNITNRDITNKAGLSHITYYRHFKSKDEVIKYYLDDITNEFIKRKNVDFDAYTIEEYIVVLFSHLKEKQDIGMLLYKANLIHYIKNEFDKIFYHKAHSKEEQYYYYFISGALYNLYYYWLMNGCKESPKELSIMLTNFLSIKKGTN